MEAENTKAPTLAEFQEVLSQGRYAIRDVDTLKGVLCDAFILYDVTEGRGRLSRAPDPWREKGRRGALAPTR
jgi:hypothetical protein